ncbi:MAG: efflux RND transporter permease subunit [Clostridia bacterium]|nr:efflux RND transporter permease subunit [Clostridia bacterium]
MDKFAHFIVKNKKIVTVLFIILTIISLFFLKNVSIKYDMGGYLPPDMDSYIANQIFSREFDIKGSAMIMIREKKINEILDIKNNIEKIEGVSKVAWLDDVIDVYQPEFFMPDDIKEQFNKGQDNLLIIKFAEGNAHQKTNQAIEQIKKIIDGEYYIGGEAAYAIDTQNTANREMPMYTGIALVIILFIISMSVSSYIESILLLVSIGAAIALNMGSNIFMGEISYMTHAAAPLLQLGVSMDYSIFLIHRYHQEKERFKNSEDAMVEAIKRSFTSIFSSALTTVAGFIALTFMNYGIGKDMGFVMAKGVLLSVVCIIILLPCLVLLFDKITERYKHKVFIPDFKGLANVFIRHRYLTLILAIIIALPIFMAQTKLDFKYSASATMHDTSISAKSTKLIEDTFQKGTDLYLLVPHQDKVKEQEFIGLIEQYPNVSMVSSMYSLADGNIPEMFLPGQLKQNFISENGFTYFTVTLVSRPEQELTKDTISQIKKDAEGYFDEIYVAGEAPVYKDLAQITRSDFKKVNMLSILFIGIILVFTFKSIIIPILLIFVIEFAIWINLSIPYFMGAPLFFVSYIIIGAIQLGASVDYAILFTSRFKENALENSDKLMAMQKTYSDCGASLLTSALTLFASTITIYFVTAIKTTGELTLLIARGALISMGTVFVLLPGLLIGAHSLMDRWHRKSY